MADEVVEVFQDCLIRADRGPQSRAIAVDLLNKYPARLISMVLSEAGRPRSYMSVGAKKVINAWLRSPPSREALILFITSMAQFMPVDLRVLQYASRILAAALRLPTGPSQAFQEIGACIAADTLASNGQIEKASRIARRTVRRFSTLQVEDSVSRLYYAYSLAVLSNCVFVAGRSNKALQFSTKALGILPREGGGIGRLLVRQAVFSAYIEQCESCEKTHKIDKEDWNRFRVAHYRRLSARNEKRIASHAMEQTEKERDSLFLANHGNRLIFDRAMFVDLLSRWADAGRAPERHFEEYFGPLQYYGTRLMSQNRSNDALALVESGVAVLADLAKRFPERYRERYILELLVYAEFCLRSAKDPNLERDWLIRAEEIVRDAESKLLKGNKGANILSRNLLNGRMYLIRAECLSRRGNDVAASKYAHLSMKFLRRHRLLTSEIAVYFYRANLLVPEDEKVNCAARMVDRTDYTL